MRVLIGPDTVGPDVSDDDLRELYSLGAVDVPWLRANMVSTVDGSATGDTGVSGSINNAARQAGLRHAALAGRRDHRRRRHGQGRGLPPHRHPRSCWSAARRRCRPRWWARRPARSTSPPARAPTASRRPARPSRGARADPRLPPGRPAPAQGHPGRARLGQPALRGRPHLLRDMVFQGCVDELTRHHRAAPGRRQQQRPDHRGCADRQAART